MTMTETAPRTVEYTPEQTAILTAARTRKNIAITAAAGTGKTTTLRAIAEQEPGRRFLYIAYNKAIQLEAAASFPSNVVCKTAHGLAWYKFGKPMMNRINGPRRTGKQNAQALGIKQGIAFNESGVKVGPVQLATKAIEMVYQFCRTPDRDLGAEHFNAPEGVTEGEARTLARIVLPYAQAAWADMTAPTGQLKPTHDVYLKLWALSNPRLNFDCVLYDEAQDADGCVAGVVDSQRCQIIAVGDSSQAIYKWRGAGDYLARMNATYRLALTQSWRFGEAIADEANVWLSVIKSEVKVVGSPHLDSTIDTLDRPDAILCRTNAGCIEQLMAAHTQDVKVHLVGEGREMVALARAAECMMNGERTAHPELVAFRTWEEVVEYANNDPSGSDLAIAVRMIETYGAEAVIDAIDKACPERDADLVVSTAHKAKGREWDTVRIATDFKQPLEKETGLPLPIPEGEAMLAYVAVTRAKKVLDNAGLAWIHGHLAELAG